MVGPAFRVSRVARLAQAGRRSAEPLRGSLPCAIYGHPVRDRRQPGLPMADQGPSTRAYVVVGVLVAALAVGVSMGLFWLLGG